MTLSIVSFLQEFMAANFLCKVSGQEGEWRRSRGSGRSFVAKWNEAKCKTEQSKSVKVDGL